MGFPATCNDLRQVPLVSGYELDLVLYRHGAAYLLLGSLVNFVAVEGGKKRLFVKKWLMEICPVSYSLD